MPVACTLRPGAWPTISTRAPGAACRTGLAPSGSAAWQTVQARASRNRLFRDIRPSLGRLSSQKDVAQHDGVVAKLVARREYERHGPLARDDAQFREQILMTAHFGSIP